MKHLLCLHGIFDRPAVFNAFKGYFEAKGFTVTVPDLNTNWGFTRVPKAAAIFKAAIEAMDFASTSEVIVVGFSMGGIIARYYLQEMNGIDELRSRTSFRKFITISSPHHGSLLGFGSPGRGGFELRPQSPLLKRLSQSESRLHGLRLLSLYTPLDLMILPASSSIWEIATNIAVPEKTHAAMLDSPKVFEEIEKWII